jgi:hypothetical protein
MLKSPRRAASADQVATASTFAEPPRGLAHTSVAGERVER